MVTAAIIHFSVHQGDIAPYSGTIYIEGNSGSDGRRIYNATIVGTGLHLEPHSEISGGVVSAIEDSEECVNDTWLNAWNAMPPQKPTKLQMFLAKITRNISFNRFNARSAESVAAARSSLFWMNWLSALPVNRMWRANTRPESLASASGCLSVRCRSGTAMYSCAVTSSLSLWRRSPSGTD